MSKSVEISRLHKDLKKMWIGELIGRKFFHFQKYEKMLKNQVMHKVIHIIHMEKHVDELIYIMGIETNVLVIVMKM